MKLNKILLFGFYMALPGYLTDHGEIERGLRRKKVEEIMEPRVHTVSSDNSIATAARIMRRLHVHRVLVVDDDRLVGIVSTLDLLQIFEKPAFFREFYGTPVKSVATNGH